MCEADRYVSWYESVERTIVFLLKRVGVEVDPGRTPEGHHAFHENVLKELQRQDNFYHDALGSGKVYETLSLAKAFCNIWRKNVITKSRRACQSYLNSISSQKMIIEAGLLAAFELPRNTGPGIDMMQRILHRQQQGKECLEQEKKAFNESCALKKEEVDKCLADQEKT